MKAPMKVIRRFMVEVPQHVLGGRNHRFAPGDLEALHEQWSYRSKSIKIDVDLVEKLLSSKKITDLVEGRGDKSEIDAWLAPRLHCAIRVSRRVAAQDEFWAWLAMAYGAAYTHARFPKDKETGLVKAPWRFTGSALRNSLSRLWWSAELLRNGEDYSAVARGLSSVRLAQFALELKYSWFRPAALGFVSAAIRDRAPLPDEDLKAMSKRANAYFSLMPPEAIAEDDVVSGRDASWWTGSISLQDLLADGLPPGPEDGRVAPETVNRMAEWFGDLLQDEGTVASES